MILPLPWPWGKKVHRSLCSLSLLPHMVLFVLITRAVNCVVRFDSWEIVAITVRFLLSDQRVKSRIMKGWKPIPKAFSALLTARWQQFPKVRFWRRDRLLRSTSIPAQKAACMVRGLLSFDRSLTEILPLKFCTMTYNVCNNPATPCMVISWQY